MQRAMSARDDAVATSRHARRAAVQAAEPMRGAEDMCADGPPETFLDVVRIFARVYCIGSLSHMRAAVPVFKKLHRWVHSSCPSAMPIVLISPAKSLNELAPPSSFPRTQPRFSAEAAELASTARKLSAAKIKSLMSVSDAIATLNVERFEAFERASTKPCALAFDGPAYKALDASTLSPADVAFAREHLRFLSGLYGVLRPTDAIAPHRLEMGTKLVTARGPDLYAYWGERIADAIAEDLALLPKTQRFVVNCASAEYWKAASRATLEKKHGARVVTCVFPGPAVHAKAARGAMCRHIVTERVVDPEGLTRFTGANGEWTFARVERDEAGGERFVFARDAATKTAKDTKKTKTLAARSAPAGGAPGTAKRAKTKR